jgi:hypothetical protein
MKTSRLPFLIPLTLLAACGSPTDPSTEPVSVTHTISFGFCPPSEYCSSRLEVSSQEAVRTLESRERPPIVQRRRLDAPQWARVAGALDPAGLRALPDVVGCPDCADGGAEGVSVAFADGQTDAVVFEYGADVAGIETLVSELRALRGLFGNPPPSTP